MIVALGNHDCALPEIDERPKVTRVHIPDETYSHVPGALTSAQFKEHLADALIYNQGTTQLPDHEMLLAVNAGWNASGHGRPAWVRVEGHPEKSAPGQADDLAAVLSNFYECPQAADYFRCDDTPVTPGGLTEADVHIERNYWTHHGAPGQYAPGVGIPDLQAIYTNGGRVIDNNHDGGGVLQTVQNGVGTGSTAATLTGCSGLTTNQATGYRIYVYSTSTGIVWGNVLSNSTTAFTVDQWYKPLTPGDSPTTATAPSTPWYFVVADGGMGSSWFAGLASGAGTPGVTDTTLASASPNVEYAYYSASGVSRKICPVTSTQGTASRNVVLTPVFTVLSADTAHVSGGVTFTQCGFFTSIVIGAVPTIKFETPVSPTATLASLNDQLTFALTCTGS